MTLNIRVKLFGTHFLKVIKNSKSIVYQKTAPSVFSEFCPITYIKFEISLWNCPKNRVT